MGHASGRLRFGRSRRLRRRRDFARVFAARCAACDDRLVVHAARNDGQRMRIGIVVGRRFGRAVRRNRFKRLVREAFRLRQAEWPDGFDVVVRPQPGATEVALAQIDASLAVLIPAAIRRAQRPSRLSRRRTGDGPAAQGICAQSPAARRESDSGQP